MHILETLRTPIRATYDVAVCGGGFGGIAAALVAARMGKRVLLLEKQYVLGGLGTAGNVTIYLPLCDGYGRQVSYGIAEELLRLSVIHGAERMYPANWLDGEGERNENAPRFQVQYNPHLFAIQVEDRLRSAGVDILYGTYVVGVDMQDGRIAHLLTENKSGRCAYAVGSVVDATGDADVAYMAGAPTTTHSRGNRVSAWYYYAGAQGYHLQELNHPDAARQHYVGLTGEEISEFVHLSHQATMQDFLRKREYDPTLWPVNMASIPQYRMTRRLVGEYTQSDDEQHIRIPSSIGMVSDWRKRGPVYEVPFGTLYSRQVKNLLCAGRCTSVTDAMWDIMRVIPCCAVSGQAAGTAAAMGQDMTALDVSALQDRLTAAGVVLHEADIV